jgi:hypothetical protein
MIFAKKIMLLSIAGTLLLSGGIVSAANESGSQVVTGKGTAAAVKKSLTPEELHQKWVNWAQKLGIDPTGKSTKELEAAVQAKKKAAAAESALKKLRKEAAKLEIDTTGKSAKQLAQAIKAKHKELKIQKRADKKKA